MTNWVHVGLWAAAAYATILGVFLAKRRWTASALGVAAANVLYVLLHLVAPFRGVLDANYAGYRAGLFEIQPGIMVTVVTGTLVAGALAAACLALLNRRGRSMAFIAGFDSLLLLTIGLPELVDALAAPSQYRIELGEYLQVPGLLAVVLGAAVFCVPLALSIVWSARRIR